MAAVIGGSVNACCKNLSRVLLAPCSPQCRSAVQSFLCSPYSIPVYVTAMTQIYPLVVGILPGCSAGSDWLFVNSILSGINILAVAWIVVKIKRTAPPEHESAFTVMSKEFLGGVDQNSTTNSTTKSGSGKRPKSPLAVLGKALGKEIMGKNNKNRGSSQQAGYGSLPILPAVEQSSDIFVRVRKVLCHDLLVAFYLLILAGWLYWQIAGMPHIGGAHECSGRIVLSLLHGWGFASFLLVIGACTCCCIPPPPQGNMMGNGRV